jgi:hypothetical protein
MNKELIKDAYHDAGHRPRNTDKRKRKMKTKEETHNSLVLTTGASGISKDKINLIVQMFIQEVEYRAEEKMLKTGKLEGSHYAAMKQVADEWKQ